MMKSLFILVMLMLLPASSLFAMTGGGYLKYCSSVDINSANFLRCGSYVIGVVDNMRANKAGDIGYQNICFPQKADELQLIQMTLNWLEDNPKSWHTWAAFAVTMAMYENYKCGCN